MGGIGGPEIFLILVVVLLVFGPSKIPEVARGLGKGLREFRRLSTDFQREINLSAALEEEEKRAAGPVGKPGPPRPGGTVPAAGTTTGATTGATTGTADPTDPTAGATGVKTGSTDTPAGPADPPTESTDTRKDRDPS